MSTAEAHEYSDMLNRVKEWPAAQRITLARRILETLESKPPDLAVHSQPRPAEGPTRGVPVEQVLGMLRTDREPPSDDECRQIVEEERWKKYGS
jgi:hypothetical protein